MALYWLVPLMLTVGQVPADPLATLRPGHPRLMLLDSGLDAIRRNIATDPTAKRWHDRLRAERDKLLTTPDTKYEIIGPRLLSASRSVLARVSTLALLYRLDADQEAGRRAVREMVAAAGWPKWNPSHFLDVAELNNAFGIGWDWLQPLLVGADREAILAGWREKGIAPALAAYRQGTNGWWANVTHNWNQVCNGGNTVAALALADELPAEARGIVTAALRNVPKALASYAPDGGWNEGPGYWDYATSYTVYLLAALDTALGTDFGLTKMAGLDQAGDFRLHFVGPSGEVFNYADAGSGAGEAECLFWLGRRYGKPLYYWQEHALSKGKAFDLAWFEPGGTDPERGGVPLDALFRGVGVGFLRGSWSDPKATWLAFKGGDNRANHSHLDLGCFVLDALGQRFFCDLGGDDYNLPGYFGAQRWTYYRLRTEGQNCLVIDGQNQNTAAKAPVLAFHSTPTDARAVVNLTAAYPMAKRVQRGYALLGRRDVLLVDEIDADQPVEAVWGAHSPAQITVDGAKAVLERNGQRLYARLLSPAGAVFAAASAVATPPQKPINGVTKLTVVLPAKTTGTRIAILLSPLADAPAPEVKPLAQWR